MRKIWPPVRLPDGSTVFVSTRGDAHDVESIIVDVVGNVVVKAAGNVECDGYLLDDGHHPPAFMHFSQIYTAFSGYTIIISPAKFDQKRSGW